MSDLFDVLTEGRTPCPHTPRHEWNKEQKQMTNETAY